MSLESISASIYGPYNNGRGDTRPADAYEVTADVDFELFEATMSDVLRAMQTAEDALPENDRRFGYSQVGQAGDVAIAASSFSKGTIAAIAGSEIKPEWIVQAAPEEVVSVAGLMLAARNVARRYHGLDIWAVNSD